MGPAVDGARHLSAPALAGVLGGEDPVLFAGVVRTLCWLVPFASSRPFFALAYSATSTFLPLPFLKSFHRSALPS